MGSGERPPPDGMSVGQRVLVEVGPVAHGGHCVARHEGQVLFVRHALPGERVVVEVTSVGRRGRFVRADVVEVLRASPDRRPAPCPVAALCGGCDWQHATVAAARGLKTQVVVEALRRFAGVELPADFAVRAVADPGRPDGPDDGLHWRTRGTLTVDPAGRAGFLAERSHEVVVGGSCPQLHPRLAQLPLFTSQWPAGHRIGFVAPAAGDPLAFDAAPPRTPVRERAAGRQWSVAADGFWQVHPGAADALVEQVRRMLEPRPGERLVDLYAGVGLFGLALRDAVPDLSVTLVESDARAVELARVNAGEHPVTVVQAGVDRWVGAVDALAGVDLVVLDPPRTGAGREVVTALSGAAVRAIAYVACDPVALARDVATFAQAGVRLVDLVALDLFPTTHHVECVALLAHVGQDPVVS